MAVGIYAITHIASGRHYIGSSLEVERRIGRHRSFLRRGKHENQRLQRAWDKHGAEAFDFNLLHETTAAEVLGVEQTYLDAFRYQLYNLCRVAGKPPGRRGPHTAVSRAKMSAAQKGRSGHPQTAETRAKIAMARRLRKCSPGEVERLRTLRLGKPWSNSQRAKGRPPVSNVTREKHRASALSMWAGRRAVNE